MGKKRAFLVTQLQFDAHWQSILSAQSLGQARAALQRRWASSLNCCGRVEMRLYDLLGVQHVDSVEPDEGSRGEENEEREKRV